MEMNFNDEESPEEPLRLPDQLIFSKNKSIILTQRLSRRKTKKNIVCVCVESVHSVHSESIGTI